MVCTTIPGNKWQSYRSAPANFLLLSALWKKVPSVRWNWFDENFGRVPLFLTTWDETNERHHVPQNPLKGCMAALQGSNPPTPSEGCKPLLNGGNSHIKQERPVISPPRSPAKAPMSPLNTSMASASTEEKPKFTNNNMSTSTSGGRLKFYKGM